MQLFCTVLQAVEFQKKINTMRHKFFLTVLLSLTVGLSFAQSNLRSGAQPSGSSTATSRGNTTAAPRSNSGSTTKPSVSAPKLQATKPASTSAGKSTVQERSTTTTPANTTPNARSGKGTTAKSTGIAKSPTTIPAVTNRSGKSVTVKQQPVATPTATIKWLTVEEALEKSKTDKRKILVDVYTDWCGWCKQMDSSTFKDPAVVNYINENYYPVKFNAEQATEVTYKGKTYKLVKQQGGKGYHELAALWLNNRLSYPTTVVLNEDQDLIQPIPGYQDAKKMDAILHYFGTDNHKKTPWEKYEKNYARER